MNFTPLFLPFPHLTTGKLKIIQKAHIVFLLQKNKIVILVVPWAIVTIVNGKIHIVRLVKKRLIK